MLTIIMKILMYSFKPNAPQGTLNWLWTGTEVCSFFQRTVLVFTIHNFVCHHSQRYFQTDFLQKKNRQKPAQQLKAGRKKLAVSWWTFWGCYKKLDTSLWSYGSAARSLDLHSSGEHNTTWMLMLRHICWMSNQERAVSPRWLINWEITEYLNRSVAAVLGYWRSH